MQYSHLQQKSCVKMSFTYPKREIMKLLADENIPEQSIEILRKNGFDIISVSQRFSGCTDEEIIKIANTENRVIVSFDLDFGDYIFHRGLEICTGVILLRLKPEKPDSISDILIETLNKKVEFNGYITIIKDNVIRQRPISH